MVISFITIEYLREAIMNEKILEGIDITYQYKTATEMVQAVNSISIEFNKGNLYAITGKSGSGKTTLLSLLAVLDVPKSGEILFEGKSLSKINRNAYRNKNIGMVFQSFNLLPHLTAIENVLIPLEIAKFSSSKRRKEKTIELLKSVGVDESQAKRKVLHLSGGEQQRVAIARALAVDPQIIFADEPTGNLDSETGEKILDLLLSIAHNEGKCVIAITHSEEVANRADTIFRMRDGKLCGV